MKRNPRQEENKLLLLYIFKEIGDMTAAQLTRFCLEYEIMEYLDMQLLLAALAEGGLLRLQGKNLFLYTLTEAGEDALSLFAKRVPHSRRMLVTDNAHAWKKRFQSEQQIRTEIWPDAQGGATAEMVVAEGDALLFSVRLQAPSVKDARKLCQRFRERSAGVYQAILLELIKEDEGETKDVSL